MTSQPSVDAWNNFVLRSQPDSYTSTDIKRSAAIAKEYLGIVNNGGINSFLTQTYTLDGSEVLLALQKVGAHVAAAEFEAVLGELKTPVLASSEEERWDLLENHWTENLDKLDCLSAAADNDLMRHLESHVRENEEFYLALK